MSEGKPKNRRRGIALATKLFLYLVGGMIVLFGILISLTFVVHRSQMERSEIENSWRLSEMIRRSTSFQMLHSEVESNGDGDAMLQDYVTEAILQILNDISETHDIKKVRIFDRKGLVLFSTSPEEIRTTLDIAEESCTSCHASDPPATHVVGDARWRIFSAGDGQRTLGLTNPIMLEQGCITSACHSSSEPGMLAGILDVQKSLHQVDDQIAGNLIWMSLAYLVTALLVAVSTGLFVSMMIHRPVHTLIEGTRRVARGELSHRLDIKARNELGDLADSFNQMTSDLREARDEITNWAKTLEKRVAEKTEELKKAQEGIIRIEKMASLGKLSAIVAHEINNPLMGILTYAKLLQRKINSRIDALPDGVEHDYDDCLKYSSIIETEAARCGEIVKNLLVFAKQTTIKLQPNSINQVLEQSIMLVNHQMEMKSIECVTGFGEGLPWVRCDAGQVQQVAVALLVNAIEAIGDDGGQITVGSEYDSRREMVRFWISDTGCGMNEETRKKIFEPFFTTKKEGNGTGLGLAVVYGIIERHGGKISVDSQPRQGTTFTIELHVNPPEPSDGIEVPQGSQPDRI